MVMVQTLKCSNAENGQLTGSPSENCDHVMYMYSNYAVYIKTLLNAFKPYT